VTSTAYASSGLPWVPFQANKLGSLAVALLTPQAWAGLLSIAAFSGSAILRFATLPAPVQQHLAYGEPAASIAYGIFGCALLLYRLRQVGAEEAMLRVQLEAAALDQLAHTYLAVRDLANTPLQTIELGVALLRIRPTDRADTLAAMARALARLRELNQLLVIHKAHVRWRPGDESFDPAESLVPRRPV
jgi:hypothetical protein